MQLPGYDAWKLASPYDKRRSKWATDTVEDGLLIEGGEVQIDATGHYDAESGCLVSVQINGKHISEADVRKALHLLNAGCGEGWCADLDGARLGELLNDACADAAADYADHGRGDW